MKKTLNYFRINLNYPFSDGKNLNRKKDFKKSEYIIFGDTMLGFELALKKFNVLRVYDKEYIPTFDITKDIPTACDIKVSINLQKKNYFLIQKN